ncbi:FAD-dependent oxidoreductase [Adlercreutzia aquisgranensis]|uniref:FAD-dependent oxidoreductase n=1 Tax=Adlercreutzia aquisgranensis TaxID=2941323 RepID=UPI00203E0322|nr:FAD-dependent oxidoreductase [Adlercreutzia aquisgranensis]
MKAVASGSDRDSANSVEPSFLTPPEPIADDDIGEIKDADVVIVGCGISGMAAARAAADEGAKVIVVEKSPRFNCRGSMGSQIGAVNSVYQQQAGYPRFDGNELVNRYMQDTLQMSKQSFLKYWVDHSGEDLEWFLELCNVEILEPGEMVPEEGINGNVYIMTKATALPSGRYPAWPTAMSINFDPSFPEDAGFFYPMQSFQSDVESKGGEFLYATWGRQLVQEDGRVVGLIAQTADGNYIRVNARKAVVLACGDFGNNEEMVAYYAPQASNLTCTYNCMDANGDICNVGEGHQMALWAGAAMEKAPYAPMSHLTDVADILLVDRSGKRFVNEELGAQSLSNVIMRCPGEVAYCITGDAVGPKVLQPGPDAKKPDPIATVEEAAAVVGCEAATLQDTIDRYNELAAAGEDRDFGKDPSKLTAIEPPYYVYEGHPGSMLVIMGGIDCDDSCRALDKNGSAVSGLYVCGNTQGCRFGAEYPMTAPGISHGIALSLGRLAGVNAATLG